MSSDISGASYALDDSGINIKFDLKDHTPNTIVDSSPFNLIASFAISNYSNYDMVPLNITAMTKYNCDITNRVIIGIPLVQYKTEFFCFKAGAQKQIKLYQLMLSTVPPPHDITYNINSPSSS
jgi:hypothetical protein